MNALRCTTAALCLMGCAARTATRQVVDGTDVSAPSRHGQAFAVLSAAAEHPEPYIRGVALAAQIRSVQTPAGGEWGPRALYDPSLWVRRDGTMAVASRMHESESTALLHAFVARVDVDPYTRCGAAMLLAVNGDTATRPVVQSALEDASGDWDAAPCALAAAAMGDGAAVERLDISLRAGELPLELQFARDLGRSGLTQVADAAAEAAALVEGPMQVPMAAASLELGSVQGEAFLRNVLASGGIEEQLSVVDVLIESQQSSAADLLRRAAALTGPVGEYARLVMASRAGDMRPLLAVARESDDRESRALALDAAARACQQEDASSRWVRQAVATMLEALSDPEDVVRMSAARALGQAGTRADAAPLVELLDDENIELRVVAAVALLKLHRVEPQGAR